MMVDETSAKRGHRYVSCFVDVATRELLLMVEGRGHEVFAVFAGDDASIRRGPSKSS